MTEPRDDLDARLQAHFAAAEPHDAPTFAATLAAARERAAVGADADKQPQHARHRPASGPRIALAAAALVAAVVGLQFLDRSTPGPAVVPDTELLLAELTTTTRWQAPSDRWLAPARLPDRGLPELDHWTYEVKTWP